MEAVKRNRLATGYCVQTLCTDPLYRGCVQTLCTAECTICPHLRLYRFVYRSSVQRPLYRQGCTVHCTEASVQGHLYRRIVQPRLYRRFVRFFVQNLCTEGSVQPTMYRGVCTEDLYTNLYRGIVHATCTENCTGVSYVLFFKSFL